MQRHCCTQRTGFMEQPPPALHPEHTHCVLRGFNTQTTPRSQAQGQAPNLRKGNHKNPPHQDDSPRAEQDLCEHKLGTSVPAVTSASSTRTSPPLLPEEPQAPLCALQSPAHLQRGIQPRAVQRVPYTTTALIYH